MAVANLFIRLPCIRHYSDWRLGFDPEGNGEPWEVEGEQHLISQLREPLGSLQRLCQGREVNLTHPWENFLKLLYCQF